MDDPWALRKLGRRVAEEPTATTTGAEAVAQGADRNLDDEGVVREAEGEGGVLEAAEMIGLWDIV